VPLLERKRALTTCSLAFGQVADGHSLRRSPGGQVAPRWSRPARSGGSSPKRLSQYAAGKRTRDWLKVKCVQTREFVVAGFTDPERSRTGFGALILGEYDGDGGLVHVGRVGTGFNEKTLQALTKACRSWRGRPARSRRRSKDRPRAARTG
jgi:bifunctional non-homologous end joining protein LigD